MFVDLCALNKHAKSTVFEVRGDKITRSHCYSSKFKLGVFPNIAYSHFLIKDVIKDFSISFLYFLRSLERRCHCMFNGETKRYFVYRCTDHTSSNTILYLAS